MSTVDILIKGKDYSATPAEFDARGFLGALGSGDWRQMLVARGLGYHIDVGGFSTPITGGGNGTVIDLDQPEFGISVASGTTIIPLRVHIAAKPGLQTTDSHESEILLAVDRSAAWAADGTVTTETAVNMRGGAVANPTGVTAFSAATADITDPVLGWELAHVVKNTDVQGIATTVNMYDLVLLYEPQTCPFLVGPCALYGYWGGDIAVDGFAQIDFIRIDSSLITGLS